MPSIDEGFGLPVAEAAACGCPAICSAVSSLPEVIDEPAALFDPMDPAAIAAAIERGLTDVDHLAVLQEASDRAASKWRWPTVARAVVSALDRITPRSGIARAPRPRLALVGPDDAAPSGVGAYDVRVVAALRRSLGADAVVHAVDLVGRPDPLPVATDRVPASTFGATVKASQFDDVVVVLGSSHFHADSLLRSRPATMPTSGCTRPHSSVPSSVPPTSAVRANGPCATSSAGSVHVDRQRLDDAHLVEVPDALVDAERLHAAGVRFLERPLERARSIIVSSEIAASLVRESADVNVSMLVLPHAFDPVHAVPIPRGADIVVAGWLTANKQPLLAVETVAALNRSGEARLVFAGNAPAELVDEVRRYAEELGVADHIEITGYPRTRRVREPGRVGAGRPGAARRSSR